MIVAFGQSLEVLAYAYVTRCVLVVILHCFARMSGIASFNRIDFDLGSARPQLPVSVPQNPSRGASDLQSSSSGILECIQKTSRPMVT